MRAILRSMWQKISKPLNTETVVLLVALIVLIIMIVLGYILKWDWTGLSRKTLWDWLQLLIIPGVLAVGGYLFNYTVNRNEQRASEHRAEVEREAAEKRAQTERDIASDNQREAALQEYIDKMSELLLEKHLRESQPADEVRTIVRVRTLTVLSRLDAIRKRSVLQFLHESSLMHKDKPIIDLNDADLRGAILDRANLSEANLSGAKMRGANLARANLARANLSGVSLYEAGLPMTILSGANLSRANLFKSFLAEANLSGADLSGAYLEKADLSRADLSKAILVEAHISMLDLFEARSLEGATMPDGSIHP